MPPIGDDLDKPLGTGTGRTRRSGSGLPSLKVALLGFSAIVATLMLSAYLSDNRGGGQPFAVAKIQASSPKRDLPAAQTTDPRPTATTTAERASERRLPAGSEVEIQNGVKIIRLGSSSASAARVIQVPQTMASANAPDPGRGLVRALAEAALPQSSPAGSPAAPALGRHAAAAEGVRSDAARVAIVVGGMGLNQATTAEALLKLPAAVTLAFAPYGSDLVSQTERARKRGHEIMLQAPMQPFDYPNVDPGPRTLTVSATSDENLERLHWFMGRFPGYVGIMNYLGGRFTADGEAFKPVLRDLAARGLVYADDGTSSRSLARALAAELSLPVVTADIALDAVARPDAVDAALLRLEVLARRKGLAVGSANGLPSTVERIERWTRAARSRGITLVPLSAAATLGDGRTVAPER